MNPEQPIVPPAHGLTAEAAEALGLEAEIPDKPSTDSAASEDYSEGISGPFQGMSTGDIVDAEILDDSRETSHPETEIDKPAERARRDRGKRQDTPPRDAKTGPPSLDEWTGFFSRVILRVVTEYYISYAFRGIDEDLLSEREVERLAMTDDERKLISVPLAEISNKSKFMRKHGRMIVASGDAFNAFVVLGIWASRVNRIANRYRPHQPKAQVRINGMDGSNGSSGQGTQDTGQEGTSGGHIPGWYTGPIRNPGSG
jgi:hypothetical protein